jgi:hypothetical protein
MAQFNAAGQTTAYSIRGSTMINVGTKIQTKATYKNYVHKTKFLLTRGLSLIWSGTKIISEFVTSGLRRDADENCALQGCNVASSGSPLKGSPLDAALYIRKVQFSFVSELLFRNNLWLNDPETFLLLLRAIDLMGYKEVVN